MHCVLCHVFRDWGTLVNCQRCLLSALRTLCKGIRDVGKQCKLYYCKLLKKVSFPLCEETMLNQCKFKVLYITQNIYSGILSPVAVDINQYVTILYEKGIVGLWVINFNRLKHSEEGYSKIIENKKVLLRERKRHTACRVASVRYAALSSE